MIGELWRAIEQRFASSQECKDAARKLYRGYDGDRAKSVIPYAIVDFLDGSTNDTLGADCETCNVRFTIHTKREVADTAEDAFEAIRATFDDCDLHIAGWETASFYRTGWEGPRVEDASQVTTLTYAVELVRQTLNPVQRGT